MLPKIILVACWRPLQWTSPDQFITHQIETSLSLEYVSVCTNTLVSPSLWHTWVWSVWVNCIVCTAWQTEAEWMAVAAQWELADSSTETLSGCQPVCYHCGPGIQFYTRFNLRKTLLLNIKKYRLGTKQHHGFVNLYGLNAEKEFPYEDN